LDRDNEHYNWNKYFQRESLQRVNGGLGSQADSLPQIVRRAAMRSEAVAQIVSKRSSQSGQERSVSFLRTRDNFGNSSWITRRD
jgi:hypothetical protein